MITRRFVLAAGIASVAMTAQAQDIVKSGVFAGDSGHQTSGAVDIVASGGGYVLRFGADFSHDGTAPDATIGFGMDGYAETFNLGPLPKNSSAQEFALPAGFDPAAVNEVYIWCRKFSVSLGSAKIS